MKKKSKVSNQRKPIMKRLQKYTLGSQGLAVLSGVLGQTVISSASVQVLDVSAIIDKTSVAGGGGTLGDNINFFLTDSADGNDRIRLAGDTNPRLFIQGENGAYVLHDGSGVNAVPRFYNVGDEVNGAGTVGEFGYISRLGTVNSPWDVDHASGAMGFKNGDNEFFFINITWVAATKTLTYTGGMFQDDSAITSITVTAVPEPSEYAAALGLGALGLAYYRRRPGNKTRPKN